MEKIIFDTSLIFAIIAINMTVIGLTSLAEMKNVVGIDYGKFLLRKYKIWGFIRVYYLLIVFALINVASLFLIIVPNYNFRLLHFWSLIVSLIFAIYYFFTYIIVESKRVKKQIYEQEILGLYYNSNEPTTYGPDIISKVNDGSRTHKKMSSNIIHYFNTYSSDSNEAFAELFGPKSIIYKYSKLLNRKRHRKYKIPVPYIYRESIGKTKELSHEFFQMYRYSEIQDRWLLEALSIFDNTHKYPSFDYIRLTNLTRVIGQINTFGTSSNLYKHKFLEHLFIYYKKAVFHKPPDNLPINTKMEIENLAIYLTNEYYTLIFFAYHNNKNQLTLHTIERLLKEMILVRESYIISPKSQLSQLIPHVIAINNEELNDLFSTLLIEYQEHQKLHKQLPFITIDEVQMQISSLEKIKVTSSTHIKNQLFGKRQKSDNDLTLIETTSENKS